MSEWETAFLHWLEHPVLHLIVSPSEELEHLRDECKRLESVSAADKRERDRVEKLYWEEYKHYSEMESEYRELKVKCADMEKMLWERLGLIYGQSN